MIYITGDCHADWRKFSTESFPEQKDMTRDDFVIVCGDFGLWHDNSTEQWWFKWFEEKNFTLLFVDGNHENFDRLYGDEFEVVDFHGGKAHKIRENIYHLMRGYIFELEGKKFFAFGGASSHDINDGILNLEDYNDDYSEEKRVEFQTFIAKNYNYMSINFSPSMNAAIYSAYLAYEAKNKQNFTFFAKECIICMNDENGYGPYCTYQSFMLDFIKDCEKNKKSDESVEFQCLK